MGFEDIKIDLRNCNKWIKDRFPNKDLITLDEFIGDYQDLISEVDYLEGELRDTKKDMEENYTPNRPDPDLYERW
jgi:hypothetical protein